MGAIKDLVDLVTDLVSRVENRQFANELRNVQGMIGSLQSEHAELVEKRLELLHENAELKKKVANLEEELEVLKTQPEASQDSIPAKLSTEEEKLLLFLAKTDRASMQEISNHLGSENAKTEYWLDNLKELDMVTFGIVFEGPTPYWLQKRGRAYLVSHGLL